MTPDRETKSERCRVIVAVDEEESSETMLAHVEPMARALDAELIVTQAVPSERQPGQHAHELADSLRTRGLDARSVVRVGLPVDVLMQCANEEQAAVVALSTHGRTGLSRLLHGSVAEKLLEREARALLIAHVPESEGDSPPAAPVRQLLLPVDGGGEWLGAIPTTAVLAKIFGAEVTVVEIVSSYAGENDMREAQLHVEAAKNELARLDVEARTEVRKGDPVRAIVELGLYEVGRPPVDMVVMAAETASGVARWRSHGLATGLIRQGVAPLFIVEPERGLAARASAL